jgi:hypothetical protein
VPGDATDPVVGRLRAALDELTQGAEPNAARLPTTPADRRRRWMLPAVAAAAVALIVGIGIAVVGRDGDTTPAAPTPTGPPVTPVATLPATIPWYGLAGTDGVTAVPPMQVDPADYRPSQVWTSPDYSRVLVASSIDRPEASTQPDDWPVMRQLANPPSGVAWAFSGDAPGATWHGIYWAPDDHTGVVVTGYGFSPDDLAGLLPALHIEHDETGPRVVSALSSLVPLADATPGFYTSPHPRPDGGISGDYAIAIAVAAGGAARPLALWGPSASAITPATTPFGDGFRMVTENQTHIWWPVDGGPFWAGISGPEAEIDDLLTRVTRVADVPAPAPTPEPDGPSPTETAPETLVAPTAPEVMPVVSGSVPSTRALNEPGMTAAQPSSVPG